MSASAPPMCSRTKPKDSPMQDTATQAGAPAPSFESPTSHPAEPMPEPNLRKPRRSLAYKVLQACASLRVTVVLFLLSFLLVFWGTWAQVDSSIWTVVNQYFRWWFVFIPLNIIFFRALPIPEHIGIPFPGGWTLGALLLTNLLAAHALRFKLSWKRSGIILLHAGLIVMMLGEFFTGVFAIEGRMTIVEGFKSNFVDSDRHSELAIVDRSDPTVDKEVVIPGSRLKKGAVLSAPELPFDVEVVDYMMNSDLRKVKAKEVNPATEGIGLHRIAVPKGETVGVDPNQSVEIASAYVKLKVKGTGEPLGTYLVSSWYTFLNRPADTVSLSGKRYSVSLRPQRTYRDYTIQLSKFQHKKFVGTEVAKDFRSFVRVIEPDKNENRSVEIYMNHPLHYRGETFYQSSLHPLTTGTVLQVVRNFAWWLPYLSCVMVACGMLVHFGIILFRFLGVQGVIPRPARGSAKRG
jgi:hypothetical protein